MGKEWLYKAGGGGDGSGGGTSAQSTKPPVNRKPKRERNNSSSGCMSAIFNLFDIQNHQFRFHHPSFISESAINNPQQSNVALQGVEAPRNSLQSPESVDVTPPSSSSSSKVKEQTNFNIPMGGIQIKTKRSRFTDDLSSECSSSPGTKTPNLVARLMGLDLLPEYSSPRPSSSSTPVNSHHRSRSLPATPRISTASRRSTDNDYHHRLSLQIDKENCNSCRGQEHESLQMKMARRRSELLVNRQDDEHTSQYAKQIANQVRERISRRLGTDITNTMSPATRLNNEQRRDSNLVLLKPKKQPPLPSPPPPSTTPAPALKTKRDDSIPFSSSPKLRMLDINNNLNRPISYSQPKPETAPLLLQTPLAKQGKAAVRDKKCKRIASERYDLRLKKIHSPEEVFVNKISKKKSTTLPNHVVNVTNTTKFLSFKKEMTSSSSTTRLPQKQVSLMSMTQLPSSLNSSYKSNGTHSLKLSVQDSIAATSSSATTGRPFSDHFDDDDDYISRIINQCGIHSTTPIFIAQWYSPSHPLHPSLFHQLEKHFYPTATVTATAGRRMIFELVDEFLVDIVKPYMSVKPRTPEYSCGMCGSELIGKLCERMRSFPAANCEVLEDIDGLIERDMGRSMRRLLSTAFEAEAEEIVREIEGEIVETMVHEMRWQLH